MLGLAVAAMTSCSNDELMEVNTNNVITFESHVNKGTRAVTNTTTAGLTTFYVFGSHGTTNVFNNVAVTKDGGNWGYTNPVAWTANQYKFAAYATKNESEKLTISYDNTTGALTFSDVVANDANDIVAAAASVDNTGLANNTVNLTFKHLLSKVQFDITNGSSDYYVKISDITFNALKQGDCTFGNDASIAWAAEGAAAAVTFDGSDNTAANATFNSEDHLVIPNQDLSTVKASFSVEFYDAADNKVYQREYTDVPLALTSGKWLPGYLYKYTGTVSPSTSEIVFSVVEVEEWTPATPGVSL